MGDRRHRPPQVLGDSLGRRRVHLHGLAAMGPASLALRLVHRPRTGPGPLALCLGTVTVGLSPAVGLDAG